MAGETGRPRNAAVNEAVLGATVALLGERGYQGLRINDVAERSGVAKTTVYRRWPTLTHLVVAAMEHARGQRDIGPTGNLGTDLDRMIRTGYGARVGGRNISDSEAAVALDLHGHADAQLRAAYRRRIIDPIRSRGIALLEDAMRRGEIRDSIDPEVVADAVIGGLIYRAAILAEPLEVEEACAFARRVVGLAR